MPPEERYALLCLPAIGQAHALQHVSAVQGELSAAELSARLARLGASLLRVEQFYDSIGGLVGYQLKSMQLVAAGMHELQAHVQQAPDAVLQTASSASSLGSAASMDSAFDALPAPPAAHDGTNSTSFHVPRGLDLAGEAGSEVGAHAALQGLSAMPQMAEIYPVGGETRPDPDQTRPDLDSSRDPATCCRWVPPLRFLAFKSSSKTDNLLWCPCQWLCTVQGWCCGDCCWCKHASSLGAPCLPAARPATGAACRCW